MRKAIFAILFICFFLSSCVDFITIVDTWHDTIAGSTCAIIKDDADWEELKKTNPFIESNIFRSVENVNIDTVIEYKKDGVRHHFLEDY